METVITIPETASYLMLGLAATAVLSVFYLVTLVTRMRNLRQDLIMIEEISREDQ